MVLCHNSQYIPHEVQPFHTYSMAPTRHMGKQVILSNLAFRFAARSFLP